MEWLLNADSSLLIFINGLHSAFMDSVMMTLTSRTPWIPLYIAILIWIFYRFGHKGGSYLYASLIVICAVLTFAVTDLGSGVIKDLVQRPRPGHIPELEGVIRLLDGKGGAFGFVSSHAANVFGLATITSLVFRRKWYTISIFIWAALVSYSRVYVGRHYPADVLAGALLGFIAGYLFYKVLSSPMVTSIIKKKS
ncbi:MAG: phosphatase PAP2 family protein [Bacteroidales bacterium]